MTEAKHTPGPWRQIREVTSEGRVFRMEVYGPDGCGRGGKPIALIPVGFTDNEANARLIAAAPDLLEACESMLRHIDDVGDNDDLMTCRDKLKAAIDKASRS